MEHSIELAEFIDRKVPANTIPVDGVFSFDHVDRNTRLFSRVYQPAPENVTTCGIIELEKPLSTREIVLVIIFFYGGSFSHSSANSAIYDTFCRHLVSMCKAVVVSVNYRRYPSIGIHVLTKTVGMLSIGLSQGWLAKTVRVQRKNTIAFLTEPVELPS